MTRSSGFWPLKGSEVCLTAYTFDQPDLVEALIGYKGSVRMIADMGQSQGNRTKLQMQTIQQVSRSGIRVRLCSGAPVHESYKEDRRAVNVGRSIRGLQHSKTMMVRVGDKSYLVIGSANWTTSSRSNVEMGVSIEGQSNLEVFTDYAASFDRIWGEAQLLQGAQSGAQSSND
jgi:phosphatidylserine/phosphatidylglycerophosphate/cardiolipin synthase-like enzyme